MANEIDEIVDDSIEDIGIDAVLERDGQKSVEKKAAWENWVALTSSLLAVVSAIAALLATFESDKAAIAESAETVYAAYQEGANANYTILQTKLDLLAAMDKRVSAEDLEQLATIKANIQQMKAKANAYDQAGQQNYKTHDRMAIAVTLFQMSILLGGLAVLVQRRVFWLFGLGFSLVGLGFLTHGLFA
ncbi:MAG: DUF4337 family protein [Candidatus Thiodiazotropha sp.]|jgi:Na+-translocating ferredoxin:NAD+ oxidoreductase RnfD subunit